MEFPVDWRPLHPVLRQEALTFEHLIPKSLGGRLTSRFLCQPCNATLGHRIEHAARFDPSIGIAVQRLIPTIPDIAGRWRKPSDISARAKQGYRPDTCVRGDFRVFSRKASRRFVQPTNEARKTVERILRKEGYAMLPLQEALRRFDEAPEILK